MSADNFMVIRRHPNGGYAAVMGFMSVDYEDGYPEATTRDTSFPTVAEAEAYADSSYCEYGTSIHPECTEGLRQESFSVATSGDYSTPDLAVAMLNALESSVPGLTPAQRANLLPRVEALVSALKE